VTSLQSAVVLRPRPRPIGAGDVAPDCYWRAVCEYPGGTPADMAVEVGKAALAAADVPAERVQWMLHTGSGPQGSQGWPIHHYIQNAVVGRHGNAMEVKQNCAGGLTSWLVASRLMDDEGVSICTGADNWAWADRLSMFRTSGGEPFSDAAYAAAIGHGGGFAKVLGSATASAPAAADDWRIGEAFWETTTTAEGFSRAYASATAERSEESKRESFGMFVAAVRGALADARLSPQYVTHFVPQASDTGQPFRLLAKVVGLPWHDSLHEHNLDHGYLGVSTHVDGLVHLAEIGSLKRDSIVLLLAAEYQMSATAIILRVTRPPRVSVDGMLRVIS
jgi:3-oxoacyl-[acyl-carrier-protein] synthase III